MKPIKTVKTFTFYTLFIVILTVSLSSVFALMEIREEAISRANRELDQSMGVFKAALTEKGKDFTIKSDQLFAGNYLLNYNPEIPDKLTRIFGETFTIFMGDTRISTSIRNKDGKRIIGTRLVGPAHEAVFIRGEPYRGDADIEGTTYITAYEPLKDPSGITVGALYTGVNKDVYLSHYNKLRFGIMGILVFIATIFSALYYSLFRQGKRSAQQSAAELTFLQTLIDTIPTPVFYKDAHGRYLGCNYAFESLVGASRHDIIDKSAHEIIGNTELTLEQEKIDLELFSAPPGTKHSTEAQMTTAGGITKDVIISRACFQNDSGQNEGIIGSILDITERKQLHKIMIEKEKMLMVGGLAAGMAHELNNPIGSILQNIQNIQRRFSTGLNANRKTAGDIGLDLNLIQSYLEQRGINEMLDYVSKASIQAADIVSKMLAFSGNGAAVMPAVQLNQLIDNAIEHVCCDYEFSNRYHTHSIKFIKEYDDNLPPVVVNRSEIEQVMINLIRNAVQAVNEVCSEDSARIVIRTSKTGRQAVIEVEDNGPGIPQEIKNRIFEPFFTTREVGSGTGMGLSVAYALVVNNHNGRILVDSLPGKGTKFSVMLPL